MYHKEKGKWYGPCRKCGKEILYNDTRKAGEPINPFIQIKKKRDKHICIKCLNEIKRVRKEKDKLKWMMGKKYSRYTYQPSEEEIREKYLEQREKLLHNIKLVSDKDYAKQNKKQINRKCYLKNREKRLDYAKQYRMTYSHTL